MLLLSLLLCCAMTAVGQVRLYGRVTDENGQAMDVVHVRLGRGSVGTLTNFKGEYELLVSESDSVRVIFTSLGYKRTEKVINTRGVKPNESGNKRMMLNVQMRPNQAVLNDVEVVTQRQTQPGNLEHFTVENVLDRLTPWLTDASENAKVRQNLAETMKLLQSDGDSIAKIARILI